MRGDQALQASFIYLRIYNSASFKFYYHQKSQCFLNLYLFPIFFCILLNCLVVLRATSHVPPPLLGLLGSYQDLAAHEHGKSVTQYSAFRDCHWFCGVAAMLFSPFPTFRRFWSHKGRPLWGLHLTTFLFLVFSKLYLCQSAFKFVLKDFLIASVRVPLLHWFETSLHYNDFLENLQKIQKRRKVLSSSCTEMPQWTCDKVFSQKAHAVWVFLL